MTARQIRRSHAPGLFFILSASVLQTAIPRPVYGQEVSAISAESETKLVGHPANVTFIVSNAASAQDAIKNATLAAGGEKVLLAVGMRTLPIPIIGSLPLEALQKVILRRGRSSKGFFVTFLPGLVADVQVSTASSFVITSGVLQSAPGATPLLLQVNSSTKDAARIVRSTRAILKISGSQINPASTEIHETQQVVIATRMENRSEGDINLIPAGPLGAGEYVIVLASPGAANHVPEATRVWDFRVP